MPFKDITGHKKVKKRLQHLIDNNHLPHALLFAGPEGVGKKLTALALAKALLCYEFKNDYCDHCPSCFKVDHGNHPDVTLIDTEGSSIKIGQMREWQDSLETRPYMGSWRVTIIDNAENMTQAAANSVLKTLEEPPEETLICLIVSNINNVLPTILSRCQIIRFSPLNKTEFCEILMSRNYITEAQAGLIYNLSHGELSRGLSMNIESIYKIRQEWKKIFYSDSIKGIIGIKTDQKSLLETLNILACWIRDIVMLQMGLEESFLTNQDMLEELRENARTLPHSLVESRIYLLLDSIEALERNANPKLALDYLFYEWGRKSQQ